jgi:uncharacterized damage-inducible protein DinB
MGTVERVRRLIDYDRAVFERYLASATRLGWAEACRDRGIGHGSIKDTLVHVLNVHEAWLAAIPQKEWAIFDAPGRQPGEVRSWSELRRYRDRVWSSVDHLLGGLTEARLRQRVKAPWMPGIYTLEDGFLQSSFEQAHHVGEIIGVYWQADRAPPKMTWIENLPPRVLRGHARAAGRRVRPR